MRETPGPTFYLFTYLFCLFVLFLFILFYFLIIYLHIFFSTVQYGDPVTLTCRHSFMAHYMFHHKWLDRVLSATQQDPTANLSRRQHSASIYHKLPALPLPPLPPWQPQVCSPSPWFTFLWKGSFVPYKIPDIRDVVWYLSFSFWLTSLRMRVLL